MKLLFLTVDRSNVVTKHWGWLQKAIANVADVDFVKISLNGMKAGQFARKVSLGEIHVKPVIKQLKKSYDFILTDANFAFKDEPWGEIKTPRGMIIQDLHYNKKDPKENPYLQVQIAKRQHWDIVFHRFRYPIMEWFPELAKMSKLVWLPHCIDVDMFKDRNIDKKYDVLMAGWHFDEYYPYRHKAHELLKDMDYYTEIERPPEIGHKDNSRWPVAGDFSTVLNQSKICITDGLKHNYVILKYYEMAASNTCIFSNWFDELADVGFKPNENMVVMNFDDLNGQIRWWLEHDKEREKIAENAYKLVMSRHTADIRAKEILEAIK
jgi:hypothetical protein